MTASLIQLFLASISCSLLAEIYLCRGSDMHFLLFDENVPSDLIGGRLCNESLAKSKDADPTLSLTSPADRPGVKTGGVPSAGPSRKGRVPGCANGSTAVQHLPDVDGSPSGALLEHSDSSNDLLKDGYGFPEAAVPGKNGRFSTAGRVQEFRATLRSAAAYAAKMKVS